MELQRFTKATEDPMTEDRMALIELLQKSGEADFLRAVAESVLQILMEADVEGLIGAGRHERTGDRLNYRNGYRDRTLDTRLGPLSLRIPKLRQGSPVLPLKCCSGKCSMTPTSGTSYGRSPWSLRKSISMSPNSMGLSLLSPRRVMLAGD